MLPLSIEPLKIEDLNAVLAIEELSFPAPWTKKMFLNDLQNESAYFIVAKNCQKIVGYAAFWFIFEEVHITNLAVRPHFRRQKVGERLVANFLKEAEIKGAKRVILEVRISNLPAQALYKKFGFHKLSIRKSYYSDTGEDALVMCKSLIAES